MEHRLVIRNDSLTPLFVRLLAVEYYLDPQSELALSRTFLADHQLTIMLPGGKDVFKILPKHSNHVSIRGDGTEHGTDVFFFTINA